MRIEEKRDKNYWTGVDGKARSQFLGRVLSRQVFCCRASATSASAWARSWTPSAVSLA
jgi:hypothetical protein